MYKTTAFLRSSSTPTSPLTAPVPIRSDSETSTEAQTRTRLTLGHFSGRKSSQAHMGPTPLVQDGSYLESLSLKLSEAVLKALSQPTSSVASPDLLYGKKPISARGGRTLGELIATELNASQGKTHLQRAILRLLHKQFSVLLTNLSSMLLPLLSSPAFLSPPAPTVQQPGPNATQSHALAVAEFSVELLNSLDKLNIEVYEHKADGLHSFKEGLRSIIGRVMNPLVGGIKNELIRHLDALEQPSSHAASVAVQSKSTGGVKVMQHTSIAALQTLVPIYAKALKCYTAPKFMQSALASLLISSVWHALVALSHRPSISGLSTQSNATSAPIASKKRLVSPPSTPPPTRFMMKLPGSRPPSPTLQMPPSTASDARTVCDLLNALPKPITTDESSRLAREAVDEAFESLSALTALLGALDIDKATSGQQEVREDPDLDLLTDRVPALIALPVLLRWSGNGEPQSIPAMLGISESEYRSGCLSGFGRADECDESVTQRVLRNLRGNSKESNVTDEKTKAFMNYLVKCLLH